MNAGIFALPIRMPLTAPAAVPNSTATMKVANPLLVELNVIAATTPVNARFEPTERSMPPVMMTSPIPIAISPTTDE